MSKNIKKRDFFDINYLKDDLKNRSVKGGAASITTQGLIFFLRMGSTVVLSRLLAPTEFGLIAMVVSISNFAMIFKDLGLSMVTIQRQKINHAQISTLFWINVAIGIMLAGIVAASAPIIAWFYDEPRLTYITLFLATSFIFSGLGIQHQALLRRHMRFLTLGIIEVTSMCCGIVIAIIFAIHGAGYWALVIQQLTITCSLTLGLWLAISWRPSWPRFGTDIKSMVTFGVDISGFNLINYFARNLDNILLGKFCGAFILGLYNKAYSLLMLPISQVRTPISNVAVPALSHLQKRPHEFRRYYCKLVSVIAFITMPTMVVMGICSENIIRLVLGQKWMGSAPVFTILAIAAFIQPVSMTRGLVLISLGQSRRYFYSGIYQSSAIIISFLIGINWGMKGIAISYVCVNYMILIPIFRYCFRFTPLSLKDFGNAIKNAILTSSFMGIIVFIARLYLNFHSDVIILTVCAIMSFFLYLIFWCIIPGGLKYLKDLYSLIKLIRPQKSVFTSVK